MCIRDSTRADAETAMRAGADAVLVGTAIWRAEDPVAFYRELSRGTQDVNI